MLLLDQLIELRDDAAVAVGRSSRDHPLLGEDGLVDPLASIELIAQAAAAMVGASRSGESGRLPGLVVGVRDLSLKGSNRPGDTIRVEVQRGRCSSVFQEVRGVVSAEGCPVAAGELKLVVGGGSEAGLAVAPVDQDVPRGATSIHPIRGRVASEGGRIHGVFRVARSLAAFAGHFPGQPLLPAAVVTALAAEPVRRTFAAGLTLAAVRRARFARPIVPENEVEVWCEGTGERAWDARVLVRGAEAASVSFELEPAEARSRVTRCG